MRAPEQYDAEIGRLWDLVWQVLERRGESKPEYAETVRTLCDNAQMKRTFQAELAVDGYTVKGSRGQPTAHPLLGELRKCDHAIHRASEALLLTPATARRAGLRDDEAADELAEFLS